MNRKKLNLICVLVTLSVLFLTVNGQGEKKVKKAKKAGKKVVKLEDRPQAQQPIAAYPDYTNYGDETDDYYEETEDFENGNGNRNANGNCKLFSICCGFLEDLIYFEKVLFSITFLLQKRKNVWSEKKTVCHV
jgi:hypothetical protein